jgi:hypothetical protein
MEIGDGQFILDVGEDCGIDYHDASQEMIGSEMAQGLLKKLSEWCADQKVVILPGVVGE